jgi:glycosyltransferase involved in cell wall biosynthesis
MRGPRREHQALIMDERVDVSVVISTYNGADRLPDGLTSALNQDAHDLSYEVIVVDNNSQDATRAVIQSFVTRGFKQLRDVFEPRQGVSYGRNAGIAVARAPIIAFFDDDVRVAGDWVRTIKRTMDEHPEVDFVGGKVLPTWQASPPAWLTDANWSPLALVDYGPTPLHVTAERQLCLVSANLAVRRSLFDAVGLFAPELQRVKDSIGSMEDHELLTRCWRAGKQGLYVPTLLASTDVPANRMTKTYHRRWHRGHGVFCAMMRFLEDTDQKGRYIGKYSAEEPVTLFGVPAFLFRQIADECWKWMLASVRRQPALAFRHENNMRFLVSYSSTRYREERAGSKRSVGAEVRSFATNLVRKKVRTALGAGEKRSA